MAEVISEKKQKIDGEHYLVTQELSDGSRRELSQILKSAWNKFKNPDSEIPKTGVYKLLSKEYRE